MPEVSLQIYMAENIYIYKSCYTNCEFDIESHPSISIYIFFISVLNIHYNNINRKIIYLKMFQNMENSKHIKIINHIGRDYK